MATRCARSASTTTTSRPPATLDFEDAFRAATGGRGVDVVLNSLAGEFVDASLRLLPRGGRFLEMGKTDVARPRTRSPPTTPASPTRPFDLVEAGAGADRRDARRDVGAVRRRRAAPACRSPTWDVRHAADAFRALSQARHIGKVVLTRARPARTRTAPC